jgi:hypothetical protein
MPSLNSRPQHDVAQEDTKTKQSFPVANFHSPHQEPILNCRLPTFNPKSSSSAPPLAHQNISASEQASPEPQSPRHKSYMASQHWPNPAHRHCPMPALSLTHPQNRHFIEPLKSTNLLDLVSLLCRVPVLCRLFSTVTGPCPRAFFLSNTEHQKPSLYRRRTLSSSFLHFCYQNHYI